MTLMLAPSSPCGGTVPATSLVPSALSRTASTAETKALAAESAVMQVTLCFTASVRSRYPSPREPGPNGVLMISAIFPSAIRSPTFGSSPSCGLEIFPTTSQVTLPPASTRAVPSVEQMSKPR